VDPLPPQHLPAQLQLAAPDPQDTTVLAELGKLTSLELTGSFHCLPPELAAMPALQRLRVSMHSRTLKTEGGAALLAVPALPVLVCFVSCWFPLARPPPPGCIS